MRSTKESPYGATLIKSPMVGIVGGGGVAADAVSAADDHPPARGTYFADQPARIRGPPHLHLPLLTLGALGFQLVWSMEMAYASPFLIELGLTKSQVAAVLMAGPISGFVVQPIMGVVADTFTHSWGRRRPFLLTACALSTASMVLLAFAKDVAALLFERETPTHRSFTQLCAIFAVFGVDFSVNVIMAMDRALYVDMLPPSQQGAVGAWAARLAGIGDVFGFLVSHADLPRSFPFYWYPSLAKMSEAGSNEGQLKCLCFITGFFLLGTHAVTAWVAEERRLLSTEYRIINAAEVVRMLRDLVQDFVQTAKTLSQPVKRVFAVQFFCWIGWFPVLFFSTVWVGSIWSEGNPSADPVSATQHGALALFYRAIIALIVSIAAPYFVTGTRAPSLPVSLVPAGATSGDLFKRIDMATLWAVSNLLMGVILFSTIIAEWSSSSNLATLLIALTGFSWAVVMWVPYSLIGVLIANERGDLGASANDRNSGSRPTSVFDASQETEQEELLNEEDREANGASDGEALPNTDKAEGGIHDKAGTVLGLLNIAIVLPQFISTSISSLIFAIADSGQKAAPAPGTPVTAREALEGSAHDASSIGFVFRFGAISAIVAAFLARSLAKRHHRELLAR